MAKAKNPLFSQEAHGALGGIMFRSGTYGQVVSRRSVSAVGRTSAQCTARGRIKHAQTLWSALSDHDKSAWAAVAVLPETGQNAFIRQACLSMMVGLTPLVLPVRGNKTIQRLELSVSSAQASTARLRLDISCDLTTEVRIIYKCFPTYSNRVDPNISSYVYATWSSAVAERVDLYLKCPAPRVHVIAEIMHTASRTITQRKHFLFKPNWK